MNEIKFPALCQTICNVAILKWDIQLPRVLAIRKEKKRSVKNVHAQFNVFNKR